MSTLILNLFKQPTISIMCMQLLLKNIFMTFHYINHKQDICILVHINKMTGSNSNEWGIDKRFWGESVHFRIPQEIGAESKVLVFVLYNTDCSNFHKMHINLSTSCANEMRWLVNAYHRIALLWILLQFSGFKH